MTKKHTAALSVLLLTALLAGIGYAGTQTSEKIGPTYPIAEKHAIRDIQARLQARRDSGELAKMEQEIQDRVSRSALNPMPVDGLSNAKKGTVRYFEPVYTVPETIYDQDGRIIAPAGTVIKPLEVAPIPFKMLFFDGREAAQVTLAKKLAVQYGDAFMPILTAGDWYDLSLEMNQAVYFDQQGRMSKSFQLSEVPSLVSQEDKRLRVEVIKP